MDVVAAIITKDGKILITRRGLNEKHGGRWEFPGGKIEINEKPETALIREIKEELDIDIKIDNFFHETIYKYSHGEVRILSYICSLITEDIKLSVHSEYRWAEKSELQNFDFLEADRDIIKVLNI